MNTWKMALACGLGLLAAGHASACYTVLGAGERVLYQGEDAPVDMRLPIVQALAQRGWGGAQMVFDQGACPTPGLVAAAPSRPADSARAASVPAVARVVADAGTGPAAAQKLAASAPARDAAPLLTDRATAQRLGLPHTVVAGDVAVVPASIAARVDTPTFTVVEAMPPQTVAAVLATGPEHRALGAPPAGMPLIASRGAAVDAAPDTAVLGAGRADLAWPAASHAGRADLAPAAILGAGPRHVLPGRGPGTVITELRNPPVTVTQRGQTVAIERNR